VTNHGHTVTLRTRSGNAVRKAMRLNQWMAQNKLCAECNDPIEFADCRFENPNCFVEGEVNRILCKVCQERALRQPKSLPGQEEPYDVVVY
jgi:hypothetical protein